MHKVNLDTIKPWVTTRITKMLGIEDDVVIEFVFNLLEDAQVRRCYEILVNTSSNLLPSLPPSLPPPPSLPSPSPSLPLPPPSLPSPSPSLPPVSQSAGHADEPNWFPPWQECSCVHAGAMGSASQRPGEHRGNTHKVPGEEERRDTPKEGTKKLALHVPKLYVSKCIFMCVCVCVCVCVR